MNDLDPAIACFAELLKETVEAGEARRLRGMLSGRELPALGGDLEPADVIQRALLGSPEYPALSRRLGHLLASVVRQEASGLKDPSQIPAGQRRLLLNILYLAAELPAEEGLFNTLKEFLPVFGMRGAGDEVSELRLALWRALVYQQTDDSLEGEWLSLLTDGEPWTEDSQTLLLTAWRGMLWIPPDSERGTSGKIVDFDRVEKGLLAFSVAVEGRAEEVPLLGGALAILTETFPRSPEFWLKNLQNRVGNFPQKLRSVIQEMWPDLEPAGSTMTPVRAPNPEDLRRVNDLLSQAEREARAILQHQEMFRDTWREVLAAESAIRAMSQANDALHRLQDLTRRIEELDSIGNRQDEIESLIRSTRKAG